VQDAGDIGQIAALLRAARRPVLVLGSDVWLGGAENAARGAAEELRLPVITNGQARGVLPGGHELLVTRARSVALRDADLVIVAGTPLDFRLGYGSFGARDAPARVVHVADTRGGIATHVQLAASAAGDLGAFFTALAVQISEHPASAGQAPTEADPDWGPGLTEAVRAAHALDAPLLATGGEGGEGGDWPEPVHPARVYSELIKVLEDDAVVIGDGGDFVSFAGKYIEPRRPGGWLDPGPFGCLGTGLGYAIAARLARPSAQVVLLLGDGAAGFSLMDADTPPTCSPAAVTTRWSAPSAVRANSSPRPEPSPPRCAALSPPTPPTSSTWSPTPRSPTLAQPRGCERTAPGQEISAIRSPSWMTSPSATCILATTPGPSASTGISIFIDSRITRVSPSST
jgi:thiamine pyrophosphate-dependent acetolactate synthase large subunit-like protein